MKLVASMIVAPSERDRYLIPCLQHLAEFCDEIVMVVDGDADDVDAISLATAVARVNDIVRLSQVPAGAFYEHEGRARQLLLDETLAKAPTHILAIDADEFVADGHAVRRACHYPAAIHTLCMQEVWNATPDLLRLRQDGGWSEHDAAILWAPEAFGPNPRIQDKALACGRVPQAVSTRGSEGIESAILHFGWTNQAERAARYQRYVEHDGGRFHRRDHLDSIMLPDDQIELFDRAWPRGWTNRRVEAILSHAGATPTRGENE